MDVGEHSGVTLSQIFGLGAVRTQFGASKGGYAYKYHYYAYGGVAPTMVLRKWIIIKGKNPIARSDWN